MTAFYTTLGAKLRAMRLALPVPLSQAKIGDALGVSFQMVQKYEKGSCRLPLDKFLAWCRLCQRAPVVVIHELEIGQ